MFQSKFFLFFLQTFLLDVGPEHLLRIFLLLVAVASRVLPTVWSPFSGTWNEGIVHCRLVEIPLGQHATFLGEYVLITFIFHAWKALASGLSWITALHFHFYLFSPSQGESGHVEGASCRVDKASKVVMNKVRRALMLQCSLVFLMCLLWCTNSLWIQLCCLPDSGMVRRHELEARGNVVFA